MTTPREGEVPAGPAAPTRPEPAGQPARGLGPSGGGHRRHSLIARDRRFGYLLAAPAVIVLLAITAYPLVYNIWNSFQRDVISSGVPPRSAIYCRTARFPPGR